MIFTLTLALFATACQAIDEAAARQTALKIVRDLRPSDTWNSASFRVTREQVGRAGYERILWKVSTGRYHVEIDDATGLVHYCRDDVLSQQIGRIVVDKNDLRKSQLERVVPRFSSAEDAVESARRALARVSWTVGPDVRVDYLKPGEADGKTIRQEVSVMFSDRPHGYKATGIGNVVTVSLDNKTGEVTTLFRWIGYTYETPNVGITSQRALEIARGAASAGEIDSMIGPRYVSLSPRSAVGTRAQEMTRNRIVPLAYIAHGSKYVVVAADDGTVLIIEYRRTAGSSNVPRSESSPLKTAAWIGIPVVGIGLAAWLLRRR